MSLLPTLNAALNALAGLLLVTGLILIRWRRRDAHAWVMRAAFAVSVGFLASYLYYHAVVVPERGHTDFRGEGWTRPAYYALLISHVILAAVTLPMVLRTLWHAHREDWARHRALARWTFPVWLYVSVTGVLVYLVLYVWNPPAVVG